MQIPNSSESQSQFILEVDAAFFDLRGRKQRCGQVSETCIPRAAALD
jgi:hypothetical protein